MILYSQKLELFEQKHKCEKITLDGAVFRYIYAEKVTEKRWFF